MAADLLVITGASRGIGRATAELYRREGIATVNLSRSPCTVPGVVNLQTDMSAGGWLDGVRERLLDRAGAGSDITLVHNAAMLGSDALGSVDAAALSRALQLNLTAAVELTQCLLPRMAPASSIIYLGSTLSEKAVAGAFSYVTSKHAVVGMMRATCQDLAGTGIHTACVCPGFTDTEMLREHLPDPAVRDSVAAGNACGRLIEPREIAATIRFCADHPVVNGAVLHANLGQLER